MDTDDARHASEEIYQRIRHQAGLNRSSSARDVTLQPELLGVSTQGRLTLREKAPERALVTQPSVKDPPTKDSESVRGAVGGDTLLNIPPCSMAEEPGEQSQSLFWPPMSDSEMDLERWRGARPKKTGPLTTQTS